MSSLMLDFDDIRPAERKVIRLCVMHPLFRTFYRERADVMREGVADLRSAWTTRPDDPELARLVAEINSESAEFAELWVQRDVRIRGFYVYRAADESSQQVLDRIIARGIEHE